MLVKFLRLIRGGRSIFKRIRIGFTLSKNSFKSVLFDHQHYFLLCILLALIQFMHLKITGVIRSRLTLGVLMTELLSGENFFEILWQDTHFMASTKDSLYTLVAFIALLYLEIVLSLFVLSAAAHYTAQQSNSIGKSIRTSLTHWRAICVWGLIEVSTQGSSSLLGEAGAVLYFVWNIITIFDVQILSFDHVSAYGVIKKSWRLFKQNFSEVVAFDVIIEGLIISMGFILYSIFKHYIPSTGLGESENYSNVIILLILYLISSVMILEVVVFTNLYRAIEKVSKH